jgi:hypothetical protein
MSDPLIIRATQNWLTAFIIHYNICPFAKHVHESGRIRYQVAGHQHWEYCLETLLAECRYLDAEPVTETTLLIFPAMGRMFDDFLDFAAIAEQLLIEQGYEGIYQLASFHPGYCFADAPGNDPANYTNRSPYPMLHIIREASITEALRGYPNPDSIPERNIELTRRLGLEKLQTLLAENPDLDRQTESPEFRTNNQE